MVQETGARIQFSQTEDGRLLVLRQLHRHLDPFQEGGPAERLRAFGLKALYGQMVDPTIEFLEAAINNVADLSSDEIWQLNCDNYTAGDNPRRFFDKYGVTIDSPDTLRPGIINFGIMLDDVRMRQDHQTGRIIRDENFNPRELAEVAYEKIEVNKRERELNEAINRIQDEPNLRKRYRLGLTLKKQVMDFIGSYSFTFHNRYDSEGTLEPTWENLALHSRWFTELKIKNGGSSTGHYGIEEAVDTAHAAIKRYPLEERLRRLPTLDRERFTGLRLQYGAKAANLITLSELGADINRLRGNRFFGIRLVVPDFKAVPVGLYRAWREGKLPDSELQPYFDWASSLKYEDRWQDEPLNSDYIVRSSAVFSEDGENVTGAGIYKSVRVDGGSRFADFKDAVTSVYGSTESQQARAYRAEHGISEEEMGLVIQRYVTPYNSCYHRQSQEGYINSRLAGIPQLMEFVTGTSRNFINRKALDFYLALYPENDKESLRGIHHFPPDQFKVIPDQPVRVAQLASIIERIWEKDVQIEFVMDGLEVNFVQVRELPANALAQVPEVQFPEEPAIHYGSSIGVGDMVLPVLGDEDNSEKEGAAIISTNEMFSMGDNSYRLPKEGAVIISNFGGRNGHIQTLCAEKGLVCIFPGLDVDLPSLRYGEFLSLRKIRVVSNGLEGRVYKGEGLS